MNSKPKMKTSHIIISQRILGGCYNDGFWI